MRYRNFCFTDFDVSEERSRALKCLECKYLIIGIETCPKTERLHYQGYIELGKQLRLKGIKSLLLSDTVHIEKRRGTAAEAAEYCKKDGDFFETGKISKPGARTDISATYALLKDGSNIRSILDEEPNYQSIRIAEKWLTYKEPHRDWAPEVTWVYGSTGSGKTRLAQEMLPDAYWANRSIKWWDGYDAHEDVIIDEFRGDFCKYHELLRLLDRYPYRIEVKGGYRQFLAKRIVITSCYHPMDVYSTVEDIGQLLRRLKSVSEVGGNTIPLPAQQKNEW